MCWECQPQPPRVLEFRPSVLSCVSGFNLQGPQSLSWGLPAQPLGGGTGCTSSAWAPVSLLQRTGGLDMLMGSLGRASLCVAPALPVPQHVAGTGQERGFKLSLEGGSSWVWGTWKLHIFHMLWAQLTFQGGSWPLCQGQLCAKDGYVRMHGSFRRERW